MKYVIEKSEPTPAYLQLYKQVRDDIIKEIYPYNSKLPSKRMIAAETDVSTVTIEHAYALLCEEGYIESRERSGYFVIFRTDDGFMAPSNKQVSHVPLTNHHAGTSPEFPFSVLVKTMRSVMNDFGETILDRAPNSGCLELREAIRQYLVRSRGIVADTEQIIIGSGSEYLYSLIVELLGRNRIYALESPSYKKIEQVYLASDVQYEMLPLSADGIESSALWACHADILHISPYRSFPSGVTATASKRHEYMRWAAKENRYIVEDDFESEFTISKKPEETLFSHTADDNVIYMNTFSKTISPSLRVGYMVLPKHLVPEFEKKLGFYSCTVPTFMQYVLAELITNGDFERHINRVRRKKRKEQGLS
ncbi:MAG: PLP-dependent aminotransferase family protein [Lachnospiraceae bacterium]|nr:PLP-dependent aminotransferase family protein [Lachnospiraceae bacterium]